MTTPVITLENVGVTYKSGLPIFKQRSIHHALRDISFEINRGDSMGIIGRNGAGKSTLLRILNGIMMPDTGSIINHGFNTTLLSLKVGYDQNVSGRDNAILSGMLMGRSHQDMLSAMPEIIEFSELGSFIDQPVKNYSSGMKQKTAIARAVIHEPSLVVLDEPTTGLDIMATSTVMDFIQRLKDKGTPVIFSTHHLDEVQMLCDRVTVINQGESVFNDSLAAFSALSDGQMHKSFLHTLKMNTAEVGQCG